MGVKKKFSSEYKTSYKSKYPCFTKLYQQNLGYRIQRRSVEHFHHVEPFLWDTDSSENDSDNSSCTDILKRSKPASLPPHIYKHEKYNKAYKDQLEKLKQKFESNLKVTTPANNVQDKGVMTASLSLQQDVEDADSSPESKHRDRSDEDRKDDRFENDETEQEQVANNVNKEEPSNGGKTIKEQQSGQRRKPENPLQHKSMPKARSKSAGRFIPKPRPFSAPVGRPLKKEKEQEEDDKAPFLPYGYKYRSVNIGKKKTYNVRASADIFPSALLAQKRRKLLIAKQEELEKSTPYREKQKRALYDDFNEKVRRETAQWETEYRHHFAGYNKEVYERSLSARPASRHHNNDLLAATW